MFYKTLCQGSLYCSCSAIPERVREREGGRERERIRNTEYGIRNFISFRPWPMKNTLSYANLHHHVLSMNYQIYDIQLN